MESQAKPAERVATTQGSTDDTLVASEFSDVMVCTAPAEFKGIKLAVPDPAKPEGPNPDLHPNPNLNPNPNPKVSS